MISLLHHDSLDDHLTSAAGILMISLILTLLLEMLVYVGR